MLPEHIFALKINAGAVTLVGMIPVAMRRSQLGKDGSHGRIDAQLGGLQLLLKGALLLTQSLPLIFGDVALALALESLELLLEIGLGYLEARIGGKSRIAVLFQLGLFVGGQDGILMMMPASGGTGGSRGGGRIGGLSESCRDTCGSQRKGGQGDALYG